MRQCASTPVLAGKTASEFEHFPADCPRDTHPRCLVHASGRPPFGGAGPDGGHIPDRQACARHCQWACANPRSAARSCCRFIPFGFSALER